jgi:5-methylcytosine-specific restriction protein A
VFASGQVYRRRDLHANYGRQQQGGISTPARHSVIFPITGDSGEQHGYRDGPRDDDTFWYTDNRAIRDHEAKGKSLHLFERVRKGFVRYIGEAQYLGNHDAVTPDRLGNPRNAIVFELSLDSSPSGADKPSLSVAESKSDSRFWHMSMEKLRDLASNEVRSDSTPKERRTNAYDRSESVRVYVRRRAQGVYEGCGANAPFENRKGKPYLEPHHIRRMADNGPDHPLWVITLCPNCHRRVHYGKEGDRFNAGLVEKLRAMDAALAV